MQYFYHRHVFKYLYLLHFYTCCIADLIQTIKNKADIANPIIIDVPWVVTYIVDWLNSDLLENVRGEWPVGREN